MDELDLEPDPELPREAAEDLSGELHLHRLLLDDRRDPERRRQQNPRRIPESQRELLHERRPLSAEADLEIDHMNHPRSGHGFQNRLICCEIRELGDRREVGEFLVGADLLQGFERGEADLGGGEEERFESFFEVERSSLERFPDRAELIEPRQYRVRERGIVRFEAFRSMDQLFELQAIEEGALELRVGGKVGSFARGIEEEGIRRGQNGRTEIRDGEMGGIEGFEVGERKKVGVWAFGRGKMGNALEVGGRIVLFSREPKHGVVPFLDGEEGGRVVRKRAGHGRNSGGGFRPTGGGGGAGAEVEDGGGLVAGRGGDRRGGIQGGIGGGKCVGERFRAGELVVLSGVYERFHEFFGSFVEEREIEMEGWFWQLEGKEMRRGEGREKKKESRNRRSFSLLLGNRNRKAFSSLSLEAFYLCVRGHVWMVWYDMVWPCMHVMMMLISIVVGGNMMT